MNDELIANAARVLHGFRKDGDTAGDEPDKLDLDQARALFEVGLLADPDDWPIQCNYCTGRAVTNGMCQRHADALGALGGAS